MYYMRASQPLPTGNLDARGKQLNINSAYLMNGWQLKEMVLVKANID